MELQAVAWVRVYPIQCFDVRLSLQRQLRKFPSGVYPGLFACIASEPSAMSYR